MHLEFTLNCQCQKKRGQSTWQSPVNHVNKKSAHNFNYDFFTWAHALTASADPKIDPYISHNSWHVSNRKLLSGLQLLSNQKLKQQDSTSNISNRVRPSFTYNCIINQTKYINSIKFSSKIKCGSSQIIKVALIITLV